jgi:hypothetical protein
LGFAPVVFLMACGWLMVGAPDLDRYYQVGGDHGYQLSLGQQLLFGKRPYVELFWHYGPLTAYTSAAGLAIHHSLLPETVICACGYAAALTLVYLIARRQAGWFVAVVLLAVNVLLIARFYKWYYWLFPLLMAWLLQGCLDRQTWRRAACFGLTAGVAFLYRIDLGIGCLALALAGSALMQVRRLPGRELLANEAWIFAGFLLPLAAWLVVLGSSSGPEAIRDYFVSYWDSARGVTRAMGLPYPRFTLAMLKHPLDVSTGTALAFLLLPVLALVALATTAAPLCWRAVLPADRYLACLCLGALAFFPQATHRSDLPHLLQVLPLFSLAIGLGFARFWQDAAASPAGQPGPALWKLAAATGMAAIGWMVLAVRPIWFGDFYQSKQGLRERYSRLAHLDRPREECDTAQVVRFVRTHTTHSETIVQLGIACHISFLAERRCSGLLPCYAPGLLTAERWQQRNLNALRNDPPALIVIPQGNLDNKPENAVDRYLPTLWSYVNERYPRVALATPACVIRCGTDFQFQPQTRTPAGNR